jgi:hypothetical protein
MAAGAHAQINVRLGYLQVLEEHLRHIVVVVLAGVDQELLELLGVLPPKPYPDP